MQECITGASVFSPLRIFQKCAGLCFLILFCFLHTMQKLRAQNSVEFMLLLGVLLIVALVLIFILSTPGGSSSDSRISASQAYWAREAHPLQVRGASLGYSQATSAANLSLVIRNTANTDITLRQIIISPGNFDSVNCLTGAPAGNISDLSILITPDEEITMILPAMMDWGSSPPKTGDFSLTFKYDSPLGPGAESGSTPLVIIPNPNALVAPPLDCGPGLSCGFGCCSAGQVCCNGGCCDSGLTCTNNICTAPLEDLGGSITHVNGYTMHTITSSGTYIANSNHNVEVLVVAGGGGGSGGAGGGAGGLVYTSAYALTIGDKTVTIGSGGVTSPYNQFIGNGENSVFDSLTAIGGGRGGNWEHSGEGGGSGGGGGASGDICTYGGSGTSGQGHNGGGNGCDNVNGQCGGGGGAGAAGLDAPSGAQSGNGGAGLDMSSHFGTSVGVSGWFAGGGAGGSYYGAGTPGTAGLGGGGAADSAGIANTGGGGGGWYQPGGSGIVIVRYLTPVSSSPLPVSGPSCFGG